MRIHNRHKPRTLNEEKEDSVIQLFSAGNSATEIAKILECPKYIIYKVLTRNGLSAKKNTKFTSSQKFSKSDQEKFCAYYNEGNSIGKTAKTFGVSYGGMRKILLLLGIILRPTAYQLPTEDIVEKYNNGASQQDIAKEFDVSQVVISRILTTSGVLIRRNTVSGERHGFWKGGRTLSNGYVRIKITPDHPFFREMALSDNYIQEHRLVMAEFLGRPLTQNETVHHIDGNKQNNNISNLQLRQGKHGRNERFQCVDCGSHNIIAVEL